MGISADYDKHLVKAWEMAADAAKTIERLREQMQRLGCHNRARQLADAAQQCRDICVAAWDHRESRAMASQEWENGGGETICQKESYVSSRASSFDLPNA